MIRPVLHVDADRARSLRVVAAIILAGVMAGCVRPGPPAPVVYGERPPPWQELTRPPAPVIEQPLPPVASQPFPSGAAAPPGRIAVRVGDTVDTVARRAGVPVGDLIAANRLAPPYALRSGQLLALPIALRHRVKNGETAYGIARLYGVDMRTLVQLNGIRPPYAVMAGQTLLVPPAPRPGGDEPAVSDQRVASIGPVPLPAATAAPLPVERAFSALPPPRAGTPTSIDEPPPRAGSVFLWPVRGRVLAAYGPQAGGLHNDGINIGAPRGTAVRAAENGVVVYAGNEIPGFGNLVLLRHDGGWMTAYGHVDAMRVRRGDTVRRGQTIATVGQTGGVTQPQLHFEIRRGSNALDPGRHLDGGTGPGISSSGARAVPPGPG